MSTKVNWNATTYKKFVLSLSEQVASIDYDKCAKDLGATESAVKSHIKRLRALAKSGKLDGPGSDDEDGEAPAPKKRKRAPAKKDGKDSKKAKDEKTEDAEVEDDEE